MTEHTLSLNELFQGSVIFQNGEMVACECGGATFTLVICEERVRFKCDHCQREYLLKELPRSVVFT